MADRVKTLFDQGLPRSKIENETIMVEEQISLRTDFVCSSRNSLPFVRSWTNKFHNPDNEMPFLIFSSSESQNIHKGTTETQQITLGKLCISRSFVEF